MKNQKGNVLLGVIIGVVVLVLIIIFASITTVPTGYVGVKTRFGQVQNDTIQEGLNFKAPFIESIVKIDCRTQKIEYTMEASSKDLQKISNLSFSTEFDQAIEKKQVVEQQTQQAKYELEKAKIENEKKIENARAEAEVMRQQNQEITDKTLELKRLEVQQELIKKWNGALPTTALGDNIPMLNLNK